MEGPWLLYDNRKDPYQEHNLVAESGSASLQADLESQLVRELKRRKDEFRPGEEYLKKWGYTTDTTGTVPYKP